jgi:hypothetical protein
MQIYVEAKDTFDWLGTATTLLSVVLGAGLAYGATRVSELRKERNERVARATLLFLKFRNVVDGIFKIDRQLRAGMANAAAAGVNGPPWTQFEEISSVGDYEEIITVEDMSILAEHEQYGLIQATTELRDGHNGVVRALVQVFSLKNELGILMPPNQMQGNVAVFAGVPPPQAGPAIANLDMLSADVLEQLERLKAQARETAPVFHDKMKKFLKVKTFPQLVLPDA